MICQVSAGKKNSWSSNSRVSHPHQSPHSLSISLSAAWLQRMVGNICEISLFLKRLLEYVQEKNELGVIDPDADLIEELEKKCKCRFNLQTFQ